MMIFRKYIRNVEKYLFPVKKGERFYIGLLDILKHKSNLFKVGFTPELQIGETVLPAIFGSVSRFNAEGKYIKHKDKPMETVFRQVDWHWQDWGGHEHSDIVDVPYQRYPREFINPPSIEMKIISTSDSEKIVVSNILKYEASNCEVIKHVINLFLEIFHECAILSNNLVPVVQRIPVKRLNWEVLPQGKYPWYKSKILDPLINKAAPGVRPVISHRFETIKQAKPDFLALGRAGFHGYVVFGFTEKNLYVLESIYFGNATYVFEENWEQLSQLTKAEILSERLQKDRIIHKNGWDASIKHLLF